MSFDDNFVTDIDFKTSKNALSKNYLNVFKTSDISTSIGFKMNYNYYKLSDV